MEAPSPIPQVTFQNQRWPGLGVKVLWLSRLWRRAEDDFFSRPVKRDFHGILLCTAGAGHLQLDFAPLELRRGLLIHFSPWQVVQQARRGNLEGRVVLFRPEFLSPKTVSLELPESLELSGPDFRAIEHAFSDLQNEYAMTDGSPEAAALLRALLDVLLHRIAILAGRSASPPERRHARDELLRQFRRELEASFHSTRQVSHYAKRLGYGERTLNRAAKSVEGLPAKALIDARVLLEAKRLLLHTMQSISAIARELGFSEPTNFAKFFRRGTGCEPTAFRRNHSGE